MSQAYGFAAKGGLNTNLNSLELLGNPGFAVRLSNFEVDPDGGYRRINGFTPFGGASAARPNTTNRVLGTFAYADGVIVCSGTDIFFSNDGATWLQINRSSVAGGGDNYTAFTGRSTLIEQIKANVSLFFLKALTLIMVKLLLQMVLINPMCFVWKEQGS